MSRFDVIGHDGGLMVVVRCPHCSSKAYFPLAQVEVGCDVSCRACARPMLVTPDDFAWIMYRSEVQRGMAQRHPQRERTSATASAHALDVKSPLAQKRSPHDAT